MSLRSFLLTKGFDIFRTGVCTGLLALAIFLVWQLATMGKGSYTVGNVASQQPPHRPIDYRVAGRVFGDAPSSALTTAAVMDTAIELVGILVADDPKESIALLRCSGTELALPVDGTLPDGEKVERIDPTSVTLARAGQERRIDWDMRGAPMDATFTILPVGRDGQADDTNSTAANLPGIRVAPAKYSPVASRLAELRNQALRAMAEQAKSKRHSSGDPNKPDR